tara:strand:- start:672 stop:977 length:306 start_codon:yes stop_codon:yes gene_type:complete
MGQDTSTQNDEDPDWEEFKSDIIHFVNRDNKLGGVVLSTSRIHYSTQDHNDARDFRLDKLVERFAKFTNIGKKKSLIEELKKKTSKNSDVITKLTEKKLKF